MHKLHIPFLVSLFALALPLVRAAEPAISQEELVRRTQELYDAVAPGNKAPWQKYYADDCLFADEKGRQMDKTKLLADLAPMPKGYSGNIRIVHPASRIIGDTAILSYDADETEVIFGQHLTARYHTIDTWLRRQGEWKIIASQTMRYYEDPAIGRADPAKFPQFSGTYELAPGTLRKVSATGDKLFLERSGKREQLFPETPELFFRKGVEGRILFRYDSAGKVDALIDRRNNEDVVWSKQRAS